MARKIEADAAHGADRGDEASESYQKSIRCFPAAPKHFAPLKASKRELIKYGFPRRPDPKTEPELWELFRRAYARPIRSIRAQVEIDQVLAKAASYRQARRIHDGRFSPSGWGGVIAKTSDFGFKPAEQAVWVYGEWTVPTMEPDYDNPNTNMIVGFWVGLDGTLNTGQVLQAGTAATVTGETINYWPWFEWWPAKPQVISNFPIAPGDLITVLVCAYTPTLGLVSMLNRSTNVTANVGVPSPDPKNIQSLGTTAEWIVEGITSDLPDWVLVGFHNCAAGTKNHRMDLSRPTITEIAGQSKNLTASVALKDRDMALVLWEGIR